MKEEQKEKELFKKLAKVLLGCRVLLLTHTDMDGAAPVVILSILFGGRVDVIHCSNAEMSRIIREKSTDPETAEKYDVILVADISCTEEDAEIIDRHKVVDVVLLDHHATALGLNRFRWACVQPELIPGSFRDSVLYGTEARPVHSSGTSLVYDYIEYCNLTDMLPNRELTKYFTFLVSGYDTWDWVNVFGKDQRFRDLQTLFVQYGIEEFETAFAERLSDPAAEVLFNDTDRLLLRIADSKRKHFLEDIVAHRIRTGNIRIGERYYSLAYCTVSENLPDVFEYMRANYDVDLHMVDYGTGVSFRTDKPDVNVAEIVKRIGGGGHPGAGGVRIPIEKRQALLEDVLDAAIYFD